MAEIYAIWYAAQIARGETMQDGLLRAAALLIAEIERLDRINTRNSAS